MIFTIYYYAFRKDETKYGFYTYMSFETASKAREYCRFLDTKSIGNSLITTIITFYRHGKQDEKLAKTYGIEKFITEGELKRLLGGEVINEEKWWKKIKS